MRLNGQHRRKSGSAWLAAGALLCVLLASPGTHVSAAADVPPQPSSSTQMVATMLANEQAAAQRKEYCLYISNERSDRTGEHLWTEKVVETSFGKLRLLIAEDGKPLSSERQAEERARLAAIVADPSAFERKESALKDDEAHARQMLAFVNRAFLFGDAHQDGAYLRIDYKPNPAYQTQSMEERVLHGAAGTMLIDPQAMRLHHIEARLPADVNIGFGLLATVRAGSSFATTRDHFGLPEWKTTMLDTDINGRVILFHTIAKNQHAEHTNFVRVPDNLNIAQAVALLEQ